MLGPGTEEVDADSAEPGHDGFRCEVLPGSSAGEKPRVAVRVHGLGVCSVVEVLLEQVGEWRGDVGLVGTEPEVAVPGGGDDDLVGGHPDDAGHGLGVEQQDDAGDAVGQGVGLVGETQSQQAQPFIVREQADWRLLVGVRRSGEG